MTGRSARRSGLWGERLEKIAAIDLSVTTTRDIPTAPYLGD